MNKRGQYYLVAAVVFAGLFFLLINTVNKLEKETNTRIYELQKEMKIESSKVIEYYANTEDIDKIEDFTKKYAQYSGKGINIYFITGNTSLGCQQVYNYTNGNKMDITPIDFDSVQNITTATIEGKLYSFKFEKGENFYFIIIQKERGETYILTG